MTVYVMPVENDRREMWEHLFGVIQLPVRSRQPRMLVQPARDACERLCYELDSHRLHPFAVARFAHYISTRTGLMYADALTLVDGWPIDASGLIVKETAVSNEERPFPFFSLWKNRTSPIMRCA